jgi:hypothetical protein
MITQKGGILVLLFWSADLKLLSKLLNYEFAYIQNIFYKERKCIKAHREETERMFWIATAIEHKNSLTSCSLYYS